MLMFLRCVGEAVAAKGIKGLLGLVPLGEQIYEIASEAIERYRRECREARLREDVEQMVQASIDEVRNDAHAVANEVLSDRPPEEIAVLEQYLTQVPAVARQSLVHPQDLSGKSVPAMMNLLDPLQFGTLLPKRTPRFRNGETVPGSPQWRFVQLLGAGGFGEVWQAQHTFLDKQRAYKFCLDPAARDRLLRHEGEIIKRVMIASAGVRPDQHGIVPLEDAYLEGEAPWLAYEYVAGGDLAILVREHATKTPELRGQRSLQILTHLADVIGRFHNLPEPIIHRDLKPANILLKKVGKNWLLRVTDFGISHVEADRGIRQATISTPQMSLGETYRGAHTPIYASPQQKRGMKPDVRDDVHALGIIGWQLLLGDLSAERPAGKWRKRLLECQLSEPVLDLLESCWDDDPEERPANAAVLAEQLRSATSTKVHAHRVKSATGEVKSAIHDPLQSSAKATNTLPPPLPAYRTEPKPGEVRTFRIHPKVKMQLCWIPPGESMLGSPKSEIQRNNDEKEHRYLSQGFWLGKYQVTQGEWEAVMESNPSYFCKTGGGLEFCNKGSVLVKFGRHEIPKAIFDLVPESVARENNVLPLSLEGNVLKLLISDPTNLDVLKKLEFILDKDIRPVLADLEHIRESINWNYGKTESKSINTSRFPVENVSWEDCQEFLQKCSLSGYMIRLPHENEWEYAYRSCKGNQQPFYWGNVLTGNMANFDGNYPYGTELKGKYLKRTSEVGSYEKIAPHPWGLCDMSGNVWEWCDNLHEDFPLLVCRGGCWNKFGRFCRAANRNYSAPANRLNSLGFRVALVPSGQ